MNKNEFQPVVGRLQKVSCSADYGKSKKYKVKHYTNNCKNYVPRHARREENSLKGEKDAPYFHGDIPNLLKGKPVKQYRKEDVFEVNTKSKKSVKKPKKIKTPILTYKNDFHFN